MKKFQIITVFAATLVIIGFLTQIFFDDRGFYLAMAAFIISISNQITRTKHRRKLKKLDKYN